MSERSNPVLRFFDENLGPVIVYGLGFFTKKNQAAPKLIQSVIFLKTAAIGDTIILSAIIAQLAKLYPEVKITLAVGSSNLEIAKMIPGVEQVLHLPMKNPLKSIQILNQKKPDAIIDFDSWPRINAILCFMSGAKFRIGFKTDGQNRHWVYHQTQEHSDQIHEVQNYSNLAKTIFPKITPPYLARIETNVGSGANPKSETKLNHSRIIFHLCAGGSLAKEKSWPLDRWTQLALQIVKPNDELLLTGTKENQEVITLLSKNIKAKSAEIKVTEAIGLSLTNLSQLIASTKLVVSIDTGIAHFAAALNIPTVVLYGPTNPARWGALGENVTVIISKSEGAGSTSLGFDNQEQAKDTMRGISVEDVAKVILR